MVVTIDGVAGSGKTTLAVFLANALQGTHFSSGVVFRRLAQKANQLGCDNTDPQILEWDSFLCEGSPELSTEKTAQRASQLAALPDVRRFALEVQQTHIKNLLKLFASVVVDGRDAGSQIWPKAEVKFYLQADAHVRAQRRVLETKEATGEVLSVIQERDARDASRKSSPLRKPEGAIVIDSSTLTIDEMCQSALKCCFKVNGVL